MLVLHLPLEIITWGRKRAKRKKKKKHEISKTDNTHTDGRQTNKISEGLKGKCHRDTWEDAFQSNAACQKLPQAQTHIYSSLAWLATCPLRRLTLGIYHTSQSDPTAFTYIVSRHLHLSGDLFECFYIYFHLIKMQMYINANHTKTYWLIFCHVQAIGGC